MALRRALRERFRVFFFKQRSDWFFFFFFFTNGFGHPMLISYYVPKTSFHHQKTKGNVNIFFFYLTLKKNLSKKLPKKIKKNCQKLSKVAQKAEKLPVIVLLVCTLGCPLILPKNKK